MSIPKNHHYVSQCHIRNFLNKSEGLIYLYDKELKNFYSSSSPKNIFSELYSNSTFVNGEVDNALLENELQENFENAFPIITKNISSLNGEEEGLKNETDIVVSNTFEMLSKYATEELANQTHQKLAELRKTKYSNLISYSEAAKKMLERMGELDFIIYKIVSNDTFLLPDNSAFIRRARINNHFNLAALDKATIIIPLTDKICVKARSKKLKNTSHGIAIIKDGNSPLVLKLNYLIYQHANQTVATSHKLNLESTILRIKDMISNMRIADHL